MGEPSGKRRRLTAREQNDLLRNFYAELDDEIDEIELIDEIDGEEEDEGIMEMVEDAMENRGEGVERNTSEELPRKQCFKNLDEVLNKNNVEALPEQTQKPFVYQNKETAKKIKSIVWDTCKVSSNDGNADETSKTN